MKKTLLYKSNIIKCLGAFIACLLFSLLISDHITLVVLASTTSKTEKQNSETKLTNNDWIKQFLKSADQRKQSILSSSTTIVKGDEYIPGKTYTGDAYYVSLNGNDSNDGLTVETAWSTLKKVNEADLKPGDAVFFERGGIWREALQCLEGVTYSAYGTGNKPRIYGSPESGVGADKWILHHQGKHGEKIWKYYKDMPDCGLIVFNEDTKWASKVSAWWDGTRYVTKNNHKKSFQITQALHNNLSFFNMIDLSGYEAPINKYDIMTKGELYLRCDQGNPGDIFNQIEFLTSEVQGYAPQIGYDKKCVVDNLCVKYFAHGGIAPRGNDSLHCGDGAVIQNCEVAFGGGCTHYYGKKGEVFFSGECINFEVSDGAVINNYLHDSYDGGIVMELPGEKALNRTFEDNLMSGNLIERCGSGVLITDCWMDYSESKNKYVFSDIMVKDNYILNIGYGWSYHQEMAFYGNGDQKAVSMNFWTCENRNKGIYIKNNVFYLSRDILLESMINKTNPAKFSNNVFVQNKKGAFALWEGQPVMIDKGREFILKLIGNQSGDLKIVK